MSAELRRLAEAAKTNPRAIDDPRVKGVSLGMADYLTIAPTQLLDLLDRLDAAEAAVARVRALVVDHPGGNPCRMDAVQSIRREDDDHFVAGSSHGLGAVGGAEMALDAVWAAVEPPQSHEPRQDDQSRVTDSGEAARGDE